MITAEDVHNLAEGKTIAELVRRNATEYGDLPAITNGWADGAATMTWSEFRDQIAAMAHGLRDLGLNHRDRLLIMSSRRIEHWIADLGAQHLGAIPCTTYDTLSTDQIGFVARHSATTVVVVEGAEQLECWLPAIGDLPALRKVVVIEDEDLPADDDRFVSYAKVIETGAGKHAEDPGEIERLTDAITPEDPVCMIYTSGTTGDPKAVVLSHGNVLHEAVAIDLLDPIPMHGGCVAYLPLAHIAERMLGIYHPIFKAGHVTACQDTAQLLGALNAVRPNSVFGVPRVWEKMATALQGALAGMDEQRRAVVDGARDLSTQVNKLREHKSEVPEDLAARQEEADRAVLMPIRTMLGLDRVVRAGSGAAPIPASVLEFLGGFGIEIGEVWGLSETTGAATVNTKEDFRLGTVGKPIPGVEIRFGEDDEVLVRGPIVFMGYLQPDGTIKPDVDADGWLATGDVGSIDEDGFLTITDRKKELIITSGGKNIAPTRVEGLLRTHPLVGQAVAIGDRRPFVTALLVLDDEAAPGWAAAHGLDTTDLDALAAHPVVRDELAGAVEQANLSLSRVEQIKKYEILATPWTPESGELTPTMKLKRRVISERYASEIDALYGS